MSSNNPGGSNIAGAITYPSRNEADEQPLPVQPRQPTNLQGLLRFAMEATKVEDAPGNSELGPMDEERRKFLEQALKSLTIDMAEVIRKSISILSDTEKMQCIQLGEELPSDVKIAFNTLLELIDDIDIANDFYKMGGFAIFPVCLGSENEEVRTLASAVLGELCQNNPYCQARALQCGLLNVLLTLVHTERGDALAKCIYAISCSVREFEPACRELTAQDGCETLAQLLQAPEPAARTKAAFLVRYLCHHHNDARDKFIEQNLVRAITALLRAGRDETTEHLLSILLALSENLDATVLRQCRDPSIALQKTLQDLLKHPELRTDRFREEKEYCQELLTRVFDNCQLESQPLDEEVADR